MRNAVLIAVLVCWVVAVRAAPDSELWPRWQAHDSASTQRIDHSAWSEWLADYRALGGNGVARVRYGAVDAAGRERLQAYIDRLSGIAIDQYSRPVQKAYWINLYNAVTVAVVLDHYPVASIRDIDIGEGWFSPGPWDAELVTVAGVPLTLNDIEHRILRPIWGDPRIHYAVNCAAISCPNLRGEAYTAKGLDATLAAAARHYVNDSRGAVIRDDRLVVSSIYDWYQADFEGSKAGVVEHLRRYAEPGLTERLAGRDGYADHRYEWALNDATPQ